ncbi:family 16 glycosylhydrolase [Plantactinospora siamensis]|uniref:Family 16 glycosylhydrolase n=1 Tax=Plantactinospora siamensis TaxID=555372 RepID=A0ABV6P6D3_9ACTN
MHTKRTLYFVLGALGVAALLGGTLPLLADDSGSTTVGAMADTTATQVVQDGDNGAKTTLATCPQTCDNNPRGWRDAVLEFAVTGLPASAGHLRARLRLHAWTDTAARVAAYGGGPAADGPGVTTSRPNLPLAAQLDVKDAVVSGFNEWDVSAAVRGNGTYTFTLRQETLNTRVYWASRENQRAAIRPELTITYDNSGPPAPSTAPVPSAALPAPSSAAPAPSPTKGDPKPSEVTVTRSPAAPTSAAAPGWRLVWSDEFSGSAVDLKRWNLRGSEGRDIDRGCNTNSPKNTFVSGGLLTLRALREPATCSSQQRQYTQSYLDTIGKASFTYGRFEMRAKSPNGPTNSRGLWPAFWLRPNDGGNGEIDVVELPGGAQYYRAATQAIFWDYTPVKQDQRYPFAKGYPGDGFHTYTTEWEPGRLRWYIDGQQVYERDRGTTPWFDKAFSKPYNIRLNFQVGGWLGDPDASTVFPADFQVDYVRVWQR